MKRKFIFAILVMGFSGIVAQILLLRELLISFHGNELSIGIILANWLILEAIGSFFVGRSVEKLKVPLNGFIILQLIFSLSLPCAIYVTRIFKVIIGVTPGEGLGLLPIFLSTFFIPALASISHGALFTFGCKIFSLYAKEDPHSIGKVYIYETLGTILGGIGITYFLIPYFHSFNIALGVSLLNSILCIYLLGLTWSGKPKILLSISIVASFIIGFLVFSKGADRLHRLSIKAQWKGQELVHYRNSIYGNVAVTKRGEQYTFFSDGIPIITSPVPDITFMEEFVHLPLLSHPKPEEILVMSGGAGGLIYEILKHPVKRVDYAELDPLILRVAKKFSTPLIEAELNDARVNIEYTDGRLFVKKTPHTYDLVFIGLSNPSDLQVNRLFTEEFFLLVKKKLKEKGIVVVSLPGSLTYISDELKNLNTCIINTLKKVYPYIKIIPGDFNLFLASTSQEVSQINHTKLKSRLKERKLKVRLLNPPHIEYKLHTRWQDWFIKSIKGGTDKINKDFHPLGLFYSLSYWNALFSPCMKGLFRWFEKINIGLFFILFSIFTIVFLYIRSKIAHHAIISIPLCIATTGFAGMIFDLALIFAFQVLYGYVFYWIGFLVTAFMVGVAAGGIVMTSLLARIKKNLSLFIKIELSIALFSGILPIIFLTLHPCVDRLIIFFFLQVIFLALSFFSGILIGAQFPLASKIYLESSRNVGKTAGLLYSADLFGGWIGGIIGGVVLLPVLGLPGTCLVVVMLKVSSLIIVVTEVRRFA